MSKDQWLSRALEALQEEGASILTIDTLVKRLGVSRGSFYWHFKNRNDFVRQVVEYWSEVFTQGIAEETSRQNTSARERLFTLMEQIVSKRLNRYDLAIRAWAVNDTVAASIVKDVDEFRLSYVRSLFEEMGFVGDDLEMRTRIMVVYQTLEPSLFSVLSHKGQLRQMKLRHAFLTQPRMADTSN